MRYLIYILLFSFSSLLAEAQSYSKLSIATTGEYYLKIDFAGKKYSPENHSTTFPNLNPGIYPLIIYRWNNGIKNWETAFNANIQLFAGKHKEIVVMRFGNNCSSEGNITPDGWSDGVTPVSTTSSSTGLPLATETQFNTIKTAVANNWSDADKLSTAKAVVKNYTFTNTQIRNLAQLLSSDGSKLTFLQHAYAFSNDKGQYFSLGDMFWSNSYKKQLMDFIAAQ